MTDLNNEYLEKLAKLCREEGFSDLADHFEQKARSALPKEKET